MKCNGIVGTISDGTNRVNNRIVIECALPKGHKGYCSEIRKDDEMSVRIPPRGKLVITKNEKMRNRFKLKPEFAAREKFENGVKEHGETWKGDRPFFELYDELLDVIVYAELAAMYLPKYVSSSEAYRARYNNIIANAKNCLEILQTTYDVYNLEKEFEND